MFLLSANKSKLSVLQKGVIASGSVNVYDIHFQFSNDWDGMERVAVFRVGKERVSVVLDETNQCKLPWECVRENDIGKELQIGVYGMISETVVLPTIWASMGNIKEGTRLGEAALPPTPSAAEQILAQCLAARDEAIAARNAAILAAGGTIPDDSEDNGESGDDENGDSTEDSGSDSNTDDGTDSGSSDETVDEEDVATDEDIDNMFDDIFG